MNLRMIIEAILIAAAIRMPGTIPYTREQFDSSLDFYLAVAGQLLGEYDFGFLLLSIIIAITLLWMKDNLKEKDYTGKILPTFFAFCLLIGKSYQETGSWVYCFGSSLNVVRFVLAMLGYALFFRRLIALWYHGWRHIATQDKKIPVFLEKLFAEHCFRNVFLLLLLAWTPMLILSFPGNVCYDAYGQISQVTGSMEYSAHHPLLHTLVMGGTVKLFYILTGTYELGVFVYVLLQACMLAAALATTLTWLKKENVSGAILGIILCIYLLSPMYSNYVTTALKDVPYGAAIIFYIVVLAEGIFHEEKRKNRVYIAILISVQLFCSLLRNNGIYVIIASGLFMSGFSVVRKHRLKENLAVFGTTCFIPLILYLTINGALIQFTDAKGVSKGEMLSLPFQQTARSLAEYGTDLEEKHLLAIKNVLGDPAYVGERYLATSADPVKALYRKDSTNDELFTYLETWFQMFFEHPDSYLEAFFAHVYGWFDPTVSNAIRYEIYEEEFFVRKALLPKLEKVLVYLYRFAERITPLSVLQNVGFYVWLLLILSEWLWRKNKSRLVLLAPLFVSLMICLLAPCFFNHLRYAFPIMFTLPFLYGVFSREEDARKI